VTFDIWETTLKGLYLLGESLGVVLLGSRRLVPSSQTFEPSVNGTYHGFSFIQDSCALCWASWAAFLASSWMRVIVRGREWWFSWSVDVFGVCIQ